MKFFPTKLSKRAGLALVLPITLGFAAVANAHPPGECGEQGECTTEGHGGASHSPMKDSCRAKFRAEKLQKFDSDKDGKLSPEERKAAHATQKAERLAKYDKDKDGTLSEVERADLVHDRVTEKFESIDTNSDAEISSAEANASCSPLGSHFGRVDADGNDSISWTEFEKVAKKRMKRMKRGHKGMRGPRGGKFRKGRGVVGPT